MGQNIYTGYDGKTICSGSNAFISELHISPNISDPNILINQKANSDEMFCLIYGEKQYLNDQYDYIGPSKAELSFSLTSGKVNHHPSSVIRPDKKNYNFWENGSKYQIDGALMNQVNRFEPKLGVLPYLAYLFSE